MLIRQHDGFLGVLLVGLFHCIVWGILGLHGFVRVVYVGFNFLLCWYFDFPSILFLDFIL